MNEKDLGKALLDLDAVTGSLAPDPRVLTARILERDRRRVRLLTWLAVGSWVLAAALVVFLLVMFGLLFPKMAQAHAEAKAMAELQKPLAATEKAVPNDAPAPWERVQYSLEVAFRMSSVGITLAVGVLALAALCT